MVDLIFFDFEKAFDKVNHLILLQKLLNLGIEGRILHWIHQFLNSRTMKVRVSDSFSDPVPILSGVPQGTCLGPLLFIIYINYIGSNLRCPFKIFADDVKLYLSYRVGSSSVLGASDVLQQDINVLVQTGNSWGLKMNAAKCAVIRFSARSCPLPHAGLSPYTIEDQPISFTDCHSDLGVTIGRDMRFHSHIHSIVGKISGLMTNLLSSTLCRDQEFMMNLYTSHIRPKLEYASVVWNVGFIGDSRLLERVQRRWTRNIAGFDEIPYQERLSRLELFSLQGRLLRNDLIMIWRIVNRKCAVPFDSLFQLAPSLGTRGHVLKLASSHVNLECRRRFFSVRVIRCWNSLSEDTVLADSLSQFKSLLYRDLGQKLYQFIE